LTIIEKDIWESNDQPKHACNCFSFTKKMIYYLSGKSID